jgi:hypothetical protein
MTLYSGGQMSQEELTLADISIRETFNKNPCMKCRANIPINGCFNFVEKVPKDVCSSFSGSWTGPPEADGDGFITKYINGVEFKDPAYGYCGGPYSAPSCQAYYGYPTSGLGGTSPMGGYKITMCKPPPVPLYTHPQYGYDPCNVLGPLLQCNVAGYPKAPMLNPLGGPFGSEYPKEVFENGRRVYKTGPTMGFLTTQCQNIGKTVQNISGPFTSATFTMVYEVGPNCPPTPVNPTSNIKGVQVSSISNATVNNRTISVGDTGPDSAILLTSGINDALQPNTVSLSQSDKNNIAQNLLNPTGANYSKVFIFPKSSDGNFTVIGLKGSGNNTKAHILSIGLSDSTLD